MALGGMVAVSDRRYRQRPRRVEAGDVVPQGGALPLTSQPAMVVGPLGASGDAA